MKRIIYPLLIILLCFLASNVTGQIGGGIIGGCVWGPIGGTLSEQTDLQAALDARCLESVFGTSIGTGLLLDSTTLKTHASLQSIAGLTEVNGNIIYTTADNTYAVLAPDAGKYLKSGTPPIWDTPAGGGGDLLADGSVPLTANWDVGAYTLTGTRFISDIAQGTAPFGCTSNTVVTNLNADLLDGESASAFQDAHAALTSLAGLAETNGGILYGTANNTYAWLAAGTSNYLLKGNGAAAPSWTNAPTVSGANLTAIPLDSDFGSNGLMARTGAGTYGIGTSFDLGLAQNSVLIGDGDGNAAPLAVAASRIIGRASSGATDDLTPSQALGIIKDGDASIWQMQNIPHGSITPDGTNCLALATHTINNLSNVLAYTCSDVNDGSFKMQVRMPENWEGGSANKFKIGINWIMAAAAGVNTETVLLQCKLCAFGPGDNINNASWLGEDIHTTTFGAAETRYDMYYSEVIVDEAIGGAGGDFVHIYCKRESADTSGATIEVVNFSVLYAVDDLDEDD